MSILCAGLKMFLLINRCGLGGAHPRVIYRSLGKSESMACSGFVKFWLVLSAYCCCLSCKSKRR